MKEVKFHTLYSKPNGVREEIPALKGKDAEVFGVKVAGTDLVPDADGKVNVPLANSTTAGVAVVATWKGVEVASNGELRGVVVNGATYPTRGNDYILSKGTLENAKEDIIRRALVSNSQIVDADKPTICKTIGAADGTPYELMAEVTTSEQTTVIDIDNLDFAEGVICVSMPAYSSAGAGYVRVYCDNGTVVTGYTAAVNTNERQATTWVDLRRGICYFSSNFAPADSNYAFGMYPTAKKSIIETLMSATKVNRIFCSEYTGAFPAGTSVKIWGKRSAT